MKFLQYSRFSTSEINICHKNAYLKFLWWHFKLHHRERFLTSSMKSKLLTMLFLVTEQHQPDSNSQVHAIKGRAALPVKWHRHTQAWHCIVTVQILFQVQGTNGFLNAKMNADNKIIQTARRIATTAWMMICCFLRLEFLFQSTLSIIK